MKRLLSAILLILIVAMQAPAFSQSAPAEVNVSIIVNGRTVSLESPPASVDGRVLVPAGQVFEMLGAKVDVYDQNSKVDIAAGGRTISMSAGTTVANVNKQQVAMEVAPVRAGESLLIPVRFAAEQLGVRIEWDNSAKAVLLGDSSKNSRAPAANKGKLVVIDAGHGGKDNGAEYGGVKEKNINLDMALCLNDLLKKEGIKTCMTRSDDTFVDLYERAGIANRLGADLFISIHNNADHSKYSGSMSLYCPTKKDGTGAFTGKSFAAIVQKELNGQLSTKNLGVISRPNLVVLRETKMPAVIAEVGYLTNKADLAKLTTKDYRQKTAEALKDAVIQALGRKQE